MKKPLTPRQEKAAAEPARIFDEVLDALPPEEADRRVRAALAFMARFRERKRLILARKRRVFNA